MFALCGVALFRLSLFEGWTFVGDSDRLNTFLNVRLFEVRSIQERGTVPFWSEQQFMGASMAGLNWMLPGASPFPYLVALFPISEAFRVSNVISMGLLIAAGWAAYLALKAYSAEPLSAALGGLVYATSAYAIHRLAQVDAAFSVLIVIPVLLLLIRRTHRATASRTFPADRRLLGLAGAVHLPPGGRVRHDPVRGVRALSGGPPARSVAGGGRRPGLRAGRPDRPAPGW